MQLQISESGAGGSCATASQDGPMVGQARATVLVGVYSAELTPVGVTFAI